MMINRILYLLSFTALLSFAACEYRDAPPPERLIVDVENGPYIQAYESGRLVLLSDADLSDRNRSLLFRIDPIYSTTCYSRWIPSPWLPADPRFELFEEIALRNGDTSFTGRIYDWFPCAFAQNFAEFHLICNLDWDEAHPAGTPLDDLVTLTFMPYGPHIRNGYKEYLTWASHITRPLDEVTPEELNIIDNFVSFGFRVPDHLMGSRLRMTLRIIDSEGKEFAAYGSLTTKVPTNTI